MTAWHSTANVMKSCRQSYDNAYSNVYKHGHSGQRQHVAQVASGHPAQTTQLTAVTAAQVIYSSVAGTMTKNITFSKHFVGAHRGRYFKIACHFKWSLPNKNPEIHIMNEEEKCSNTLQTRTPHNTAKCCIDAVNCAVVSVCLKMVLQLTCPSTTSAVAPSRFGCCCFLSSSRVSWMWLIDFIQCKCKHCTSIHKI